MNLGRWFFLIVMVAIIVAFTLMGQSLQEQRDEDRNPTPSVSVTP